jgi:hypothetical protein
MSRMLHFGEALEHAVELRCDQDAVRLSENRRPKAEAADS